MLQSIIEGVVFDIHSTFNPVKGLYTYSCPDAGFSKSYDPKECSFDDMYNDFMSILNDFYPDVAL